MSYSNKPTCLESNCIAFEPQFLEENVVLHLLYLLQWEWLDIHNTDYFGVYERIRLNDPVLPCQL
jgi:hypothetical protein